MKPPHTLSNLVATIYQASLQAQHLLGELDRKLRSEDASWDDDVIPPLKELVLAQLGAQYSNYPNLDSLPGCDKEAILENIPVDIPLELAVDTIPDGIFWERLAKSRWSHQNFPRPHTICNVADYGYSWRRLVLERHLQEYLENLDPVVADHEELIAIFKMCSEHVRRLDIRELKREVPVSLPDTIAEEDPPNNYLSDHFDLTLYLPLLHHLEEFHLVFTKRYQGEKFKWDDLRVSTKDLEHIGQGLANVPSMQVLHIHRSQVDDYRLAALLRPLVNAHHPLIHLDFSHCQISDEGALALAASMLELPNLRTLILTNNRIGPRGAKGIAYALAVQTAQEAGSLRFKSTGSPLGSHHIVPIEGSTASPRMLQGLLKEPNRSHTGSHLSPPMRFGMPNEALSGMSVSTAHTIKGCSLTSAHSGLVRTLDTLDLSLNPIGDLGGMFIASAISRGGGPAVIDMAGCGLENKAGLHLAESLRFTQLVQAMDLSSNPLSEAAGFAFVEALYENAHLLQLDLRDSLALPEDLEKIAESLEHNWERRRELWELQRLQERRMSIDLETRTGESDTYRMCSDRASALASSLRLRETRLSAVGDSLLAIAPDVDSALDNLREEDATAGGDKVHVPRQICEQDPELIDDTEIYCRDALDSLVPLNFVDERCQLANLCISRADDEEGSEQACGDRRSTVTSSHSPQVAPRSASRIN